LVSCLGRKWSAEGQTVMATDYRRASVGGLGCGGEGRATGRFVSRLKSEIQPSKEGAAMIIMVESWKKK
jgi:hypothetical protein